MFSPVLFSENGPAADGAILAASLVLAGWLLAIAVIDARTLRIPDRLSLPLIAAGFGVALIAGLPLAAHLIGAAVGYAVLAGIGEVYFRRTGTEALGLGDAKLFAAAGAWLGWQALPSVLLIAALSGLGFALLRRRGGTGAGRGAKPAEAAQLAFGPWLALGFWTLWIWQTFLPAV